MKKQFIILGLLVSLLCGCSQTTVSPERWERAHELVDKGDLALRQGRFDDAEVAFSMAWDIAKVPSAVDGKGCVALVRGDLATAERYFSQALETDNEYKHALGNLALVRDLQGREREAKELYNQALEADPENVQARNNRAVLEYESEGSTLGALRELRKAALSEDRGVIGANIEVLSSHKENALGKVAESHGEAR